MQLTQFELEKYDRHLRIDGFTPEMQIALKQARVLVIGAGGLGCPVLQYLASAGVGHIGIVDPDRVSVSNLQRQILYTPAQVGQSKALIASDRLHAMCEEIHTDIYEEWLTDELAETLFPQYDLVVGATDNYKSRYLIDRQSQKHGIPFVHGAIRELEGQLSVFNYRNQTSYAGLFGEQPAEAGSPIGVLGAIPGIIGSMMALEVLKIITGKGEVMEGKLLLFNGATNQLRVIR